MTCCGHAPPPRVPNAKEGRDDPKLDVYGMSGIPAEFADLHNDSACTTTAATAPTMRLLAPAPCPCHTHTHSTWAHV